MFRFSADVFDRACWIPVARSIGNAGGDRLYRGASAAGFSDASLLDQFANEQDEGAFAALVARHGPMVLWFAGDWFANGPTLRMRSRPRFSSSRGAAVIHPESGKAPEPVELRVAVGVAVTVRVNDKATGEPIANAIVHIKNLVGRARERTNWTEPTRRADRRERLAFRGVYPIQWSKTRTRSIP
jgi:hypothetical protein